MLLTAPRARRFISAMHDLMTTTHHFIERGEEFVYRP
jgi:hypothetical protein